MRTKKEFENEIKRILLKLHPSAKSFKLNLYNRAVSEKKFIGGTKDARGRYVPSKQEIQIYMNAIKKDRPEEIDYNEYGKRLRFLYVTLHEFAHHIHFTDAKYKPPTSEKTFHGSTFNRIYEKLVEKFRVLAKTENVKVFLEQDEISKAISRKNI